MRWLTVYVLHRELATTLDEVRFLMRFNGELPSGGGTT
jgi:hypothetical protein